MLSNTHAHSHNRVPILPPSLNFPLVSEFIVALTGVIKSSSKELELYPQKCSSVSLPPRHILRQASSPLPTPKALHQLLLSSFLPEQDFPRMRVLRRSSLFPQVWGTEDWLSPHLPPGQVPLGLWFSIAL